MHLYHASVYVSNFSRVQHAYAQLTERGRQMYAEGMTHVLESYHYVKHGFFLHRARADGVKFFLDSGAFSAMTLGVQMDLGEYCDFIHANADVVLMPSVLDAIGDPDGTWRNQVAMEERGVRPLPCYHYGEPTEVADWYAANYDYITIGGMVPVPNNQLELWLDRIWEEHLTDAEGRPRCKVHGFGLTSFRLMNKYPWYSVDSSSWQAYGSNGHIVLPPGKPLSVSSKASHRKLPGQHYTTLTPPLQEAVRRMVEAEGMSLEQMAEHHSHRWVWNVWQMPKIARTRGHRETFTSVQPELF